MAVVVCIDDAVVVGIFGEMNFPFQSERETHGIRSNFVVVNVFGCLAKLFHHVSIKVYCLRLCELID